MLAGDPWMAHSLLSAPLNLGLLDPLEVVQQAEEAYRDGEIPIASAEGFIRQIIGWRDYVWHLYWHQAADYRRPQRAAAPRRRATGLVRRARRRRGTGPVPVRDAGRIGEHGWVHHIPRLMVLGQLRPAAAAGTRSS